LLILGGILFLLLNIGILPHLGNLMIAFVFVAGGLVFLLVFLRDMDHWWALFPGFALLGIAEIIAVNVIFPVLGERVSGGLFLGTLALSFLIVYVLRPENWWAVIPGGTLLTLAVVATLDTIGLETLGGPVFFLGLALTFGLVYLLPTAHGRMTWALWPAGACLMMSAVVLFAATNLFVYVFPVALIAGGAYLLLRYRNNEERSNGGLEDNPQERTETVEL
jgi:hypothetical protein